MEDNAQVGQVDWQQKALELQLQVEQLNSKLRDSVEMTRLSQFYISQLQQEREKTTVAKIEEALQIYIGQKKSQEPTPTVP